MLANSCIRFSRLSGVAILAMSVFAGCGGSESPVSPGGDTPYTQTLTGNVAMFGESGHPITAPRSGNMTARLAWADGNVDLDLYLAAANCNQSLYAADCQVLTGSIATTGTAESVARTVSANEQFHLWVDNLSATQGMNYTVTLTID